MEDMRKFFTTVVAVVLPLLASCTSTQYARSSSKGGMSEQGASVAFNPFAGMIDINVNAGVYASGGGGYRGGPSCPPQRPQYGGGYQRPPQYGRPQQSCGYRQPQYRPQPQCRPRQGYGGRPTLGSHSSRPIRVGPVEFSDSNPGGVWH